jgi:hypothetical protein
VVDLLDSGAIVNGSGLQLYLETFLEKNAILVALIRMLVPRSMFAMI